MYSEENDNAFIRELYRLKGFAYLRNQQKMETMAGAIDQAKIEAQNEKEPEQKNFVAKAAVNF